MFVFASLRASKSSVGEKGKGWGPIWDSNSSSSISEDGSYSTSLSQVFVQESFIHARDLADEDTYVN